MSKKNNYLRHYLTNFCKIYNLLEIVAGRERHIHNVSMTNVPHCGICWNSLCNQILTYFSFLRNKRSRSGRQYGPLFQANNKGITLILVVRGFWFSHFKNLRIQCYYFWNFETLAMKTRKICFSWMLVKQDNLYIFNLSFNFICKWSCIHYICCLND